MRKKRESHLLILGTGAAKGEAGGGARPEMKANHLVRSHNYVAASLFAHILILRLNPSQPEIEVMKLF